MTVTLAVPCHAPSAHPHWRRRERFLLPLGIGAASSLWANGHRGYVHKATFTVLPQTPVVRAECTAHGAVWLSSSGCQWSRLPVDGPGRCRGTAGHVRRFARDLRLGSTQPVVVRATFPATTFSRLPPEWAGRSVMPQRPCLRGIVTSGPPGTRDSGGRFLCPEKRTHMPMSGCLGTREGASTQAA